MLALNLPQYEYKIRKKEGRLEIYDPIRKKFLLLTPEEWVRQHFLHLLIIHLQVPAMLIKMESRHLYNSLPKRCDIEVFSPDMKPLLLVECKATHVALGDKSLLQIACYNSEIQVPFLAITNGIVHDYYRKIEDGYMQIAELPVYGEMINR